MKWKMMLEEYYIDKDETGFWRVFITPSV